MAGYVKPGYVKPGYVKSDDITPVLIPYVSISLGRLGATIYGAAGAFDIPHLAMAALTGLWVEWQAVMCTARTLAIWVYGVRSTRAG